MLEKLISEVRSNIRINHHELDDEIKNLIETSIEDLITSGIASSYFAEDKLRPMLKTAIITYCKGNFGYDNPEAERFIASYELQKQKLAISHHDYVKSESGNNGTI